MDPLIQRMREQIVYNPQTGAFFWAEGFGRDVTRPIGWEHDTGHLKLDFEGVKYYAHRVAFAIIEGRWPDIIDHANADRKDNRWANLRECSPAQNTYNSPKRSHSSQPYKGVRLARGSDKWCARIRHNKREIWLGTHDTAEEAHAAYCRAAERLHGEFARFS